MANNGSFKVVEKGDGEGASLSIGQYVRNNGEIVHFPAVFQNIGAIVDNWGEFQPRDDDVWLVSYSRAGTHLTFEILQMLLKGEATPASTYKMSHMIENAADVQEINAFPTPRVLNTHIRPKYLPLEHLKKSKIVHVARNPKSIAVSNYFQISGLEGMSYRGTLHGYLPLFLNGHYELYGSWFEFMFDWWDFAKTHDNFHMLFYEDLIQNKHAETTKLAEFLGAKNDDAFISQVVEASSFEKMKTGVGKSEQALVEAGKDFIGKKTQQMRKGKIADWKNHTTVADNEMFDEFYNEKMKDNPDLKSKIRFE